MRQVGLLFQETSIIIPFPFILVEGGQLVKVCYLGAGFQYNELILVAARRSGKSCAGDW